MCAKIHIPFWPVPMTLHTLAVMTIALACGPRLATLTFLAYLGAGAIGLPVFSGTPERGIGLAYMVGPTGGYLAGYLLGIWLAARLALGRGMAGRIGAMVAGLAVTYGLGLPWLGLYIPADQILPLGFTPFILGDLLTILLVAAGAAFVPDRLIGRVGS
nr:biotin transporter BioY [Ancylobacter lacus]